MRNFFDFEKTSRKIKIIIDNGFLRCYNANRRY